MLGKPPEPKLKRISLLKIKKNRGAERENLFFNLLSAIILLQFYQIVLNIPNFIRFTKIKQDSQ